jgi:hypothetical protein
MVTRYFSPATGTWHDNLSEASTVIAKHTGKPKCYAHPVIPDPKCSMCHDELAYLRKRKNGEMADEAR